VVTKKVWAADIMIEDIVRPAEIVGPDTLVPEAL
jgi:hypothetical protein